MQTTDQLSRQLVTLLDYVRYGASQMAKAGVYFGHGTDNALDESTYLVLQTLRLPINFDPQLWNCALIEAERFELLNVFEVRCRERLPAPYITGTAYYCGLPFFVDERVLIPRSPISELIEHQFTPYWLGEREVTQILDLCSGSGCIGIAAAYAFPQALVDLVEYDEGALQVAERNIALHQLEHRVQAWQSDLFDGLPAGKRYDIIVANPPYVDAEDMDNLPPEYRHEPRLALEAGDDGLALVRRILLEARHYLEPDGLLVVEVGNSWEHLEQVFPDIAFNWIEFHNGGFGVFALTAEELQAYGELLEGV